MLYNENFGCLLIGCLLKQPQLLSQPNYPLSKKDFSPNKFHKVMYIAIRKLVSMGCQEITSVELDDVLKTHAPSYEIANDNDYMSFVDTVKDLANVENYEAYYTAIRKFSLLRELKEQGIDIKEFYDELEEETEQQGKLEKLSIQDILNEVEFKTIQLRNQYDVKYVRQEMTAGENTEDLIAQFEETPAFGAQLCSPYLTSLFRGWCRGHLIMESSPSGTGKALPNSTVIPTVDGWKRVDEVKVGDMLYDRHGKPTEVLGVFPQGVKEKWKVTFKDGREAICCDEHLWTYWYKGKINGKQGLKLRTETLREIYSRNNLQKNDKSLRYIVPVNDPVEFPKKEYYVPPYIMGLILGDGSFRINKTNKIFAYSSPDERLPMQIAKTMGWEATKNSIHNYNWTFLENGERVWVQDILKEFPELVNAYSGDKYIPEPYMNGSIQQRMDLLNGLLDTDGSVNADSGSVTFSTTSRQMANNVQTLCRSLGMVTHLSIDRRAERYHSGFCAAVRISAPPEIKRQLFRLPEKKERILNREKSRKRCESNCGNPIVSIEPMHESEEMTCFMVDNDEHLFLMNDYIVTHNTRMSVRDLCGVSIDTLWDNEAQDFISNPNFQGPGLFIHTELSTDTEIDPMFLSCVSGVEAKHITMGMLNHEEKLRVIKAGEILRNNQLRLVDMADFTCQSIDRKIKECVEGYGMQYCVFDYVQLNSAVTQEYRQNVSTQGREDLILRNITLELKDIAQKYLVGIKTMSQLNGVEKTLDFPDESCFSGGKSQKNKLDAACITLPAKDRPKELKKIEPFLHKRGFGKDSCIKPNLISYVAKARFGEYADQKIKVWRYFDRGNFTNIDLFCTDQYDELVNIPRPVLEDF